MCAPPGCPRGCSTLSCPTLQGCVASSEECATRDRVPRLCCPRLDPVLSHTSLECPTRGPVPSGGLLSRNDKAVPSSNATGISSTSEEGRVLLLPCQCRQLGAGEEGVRGGGRSEGQRKDRVCGGFASGLQHALFFSLLLINPLTHLPIHPPLSIRHPSSLYPPTHPSLPPSICLPTHLSSTHPPIHLLISFYPPTSGV